MFLKGQITPVWGPLISEDSLSWADFSGIVSAAKRHLTQNLDPPGAAHTSNRSMTCTKAWPSWLPQCNNEGADFHQSSAWGQQGLALGLVPTSSSPVVYCSFFPLSSQMSNPEAFVNRHLAHSLCLRVCFWGNSSELTALHFTLKSSYLSCFPGSSRRKTVLSR